MFPTSTHKGQAIMAFPDVCKTPGGLGPTPIPYPNMATSNAGAKIPSATKTTVTKSTFTKSSGDANGLRSQLGILHQKIMSMPPNNTTAWHAALDEYVLTSAKLFKALSN